jgi:hypothetical protein
VINPWLKFEVIDLTITKKTLGPGIIERTNMVTNIVAALLKLIEIIGDISHLRDSCFLQNVRITEQGEVVAQL